jgi:hypothetical protein
MKPLNFSITNRSLLVLILICLVGAPIIGFIGTLSSQFLYQISVAARLPAPITLLLTWSILILLSALLFGRVIWLYRVQHPWIVGECAVGFGISVYLAFLIFSSRFSPNTGVNLIRFNWWGNLPIVGGLVAMLVIPNVAQSQEPVCENCERWYGPAQHVGNVPLLQRDEFLRLMDGGQFHEAGSLIIEEEEAAPPNLEIYHQRCSECQMSDHVIIIKETFLNFQGMVKRRVLRRGFVSLSQSVDLVRQVVGVRQN